VSDTARNPDGYHRGFWLLPWAARCAGTVALRYEDVTRIIRLTMLERSIVHLDLSGDRR
jgi:hypothetical protein